MVTFHKPTQKNGPDGVQAHRVNCLKSNSGFEEGKQYAVYIQRKTNEPRIAVYTSSGMNNNTIYHVFENDQDVHDHFEEVER